MPRTFLVAFLGCLSLHIAWTLATPIGAAPDEPAHVYHAVSVWEGNLVPSAHTEDGTWVVQVPSAVVRYMEAPACVRFAPQTPASCARPYATTGTVSSVESGVAHYFPLYYYAVGWPAWLSPTVGGFYAMRTVSLLVSSFLLALAMTTTVRTVGGRWASLALPIAVTPQVLWLGSVVNPNGWEVDAGLLAWSAALALVSRNSSESPRTLWVKFALGAAVVALLRRLGPLWLVLILAGVLAAWSCLAPDRRRDLRRVLARRGRVVLVVVAGVAAVSAWWHLTFDHVFVSGVHGVRNPGPAPGGLPETLRALLPDPVGWVDQTYGRFGWLDTFVPSWIVLTWIAVGSVMFALVILGTEKRTRVAASVAVALGLWVTIPLTFEATVGRQIGIHFWQARYIMPFCQGVALALAVLGAHWRNANPELGRLLRVGPPVAWLLWPVLGTVTFVVALHRYAAGVDAPWSLDALSWAPPGGFVPAAGLAVLGGVALVMALQRHGELAETALSSDPLGSGVPVPLETPAGVAP